MSQRIAPPDDYGQRIEKTPRGKIVGARRMAIIARDGFQCVRCDETEGLEVDHIKPLIDGGADTDENCETLCHRHHKLKTAREATERARADRRAFKHAGGKKPGAGRLRGRGFPKWRPPEIAP